MVVERNALQEDVFPRLRAWCRTKGVTFQAIDLRWGISQEAGLNQRATDVCLNEIARCQKSTMRPNFLLLMGDRYGWRPLPDDIPAREWDEFFPNITHPDDQNLLNQWYKRDDNAVLPLYVLQKRTGEFVDYPRWADVENRLQTILLSAISHLGWDERTRMKYETSVTAQEIEAGIFDYAGDGAICFFRTIHNLPHDKTAKDYRDMKAGVPDADARGRLLALKDRIRRHIPHNVHDYEATWRGDAPDIDLKAFCDSVYVVLHSAIEAEIATMQTLTAQQIEQDAHDAFRDERGLLVIGRDDVLNRVRAYIRSDNQSPLVLYGQSGVGKSSIMAKAITDNAFLYRFIGTTPPSSDIRQVIYGLCEQIATRYGISETIPQDYDELIEAFPTFLASATADKPLVIFLDALDQFSNTNVPMNLRWLPKDLPPHVKLVMSVIPNIYLTALKRQLPAENLIEIPTLAQGDADTLLDKWLAGENEPDAKKRIVRTLQPHQRDEVMTKFAHTGLPLYLKLAFEEAKLWRSYDLNTLLQDNVPSLIRHNLFRRLSDNAEHGELLVNRSMAYLRTSRNGLTEDEILDLLKADKAYWDDFYAKSFHKEALDVIGGVPIVVWSRLYFDLAPYMTQRSADGTALWAFFHRQFNEVVDATYLSDDVRQDRHAHLAGYFMAQELYLGDIPNARKVSEQAYQQAMAGMKDEYVATLTIYKFLEASLDVNGVSALIEDCGLMQDKVVRLIQSALSMSAHVLVHDKRALAHQLAGRLMHHYTKMDEIRTFLDVVMTTPNNLFPLNPESEYGILNPAGGMLKRIFEHEQVVGAYKFDNNCILSWGHDKALRLWDLNGESIIFRGHQDNIRGAIQVDANHFISWGQDGVLFLWDINGTCQQVFDGHSNSVIGCTLLPDNCLLSWSWDATLKVWDMSGNCIQTLVGHEEPVMGVVVSSGQKILSWGLDSTIRLWNLDDNSCIELQGHFTSVNGATVLPNGYILSWGKFTFGQGGDLCIWYGDGKLYKRLDSYPNGGISGVLLLSSEDRFITWGGYSMNRPNTNIIIWDIEGNQIAQLTEHSRKINGALNLPNGQFVTWSDDGTLCLWNLDGILFRKLEQHSRSVEGALLTSDKNILSWSDDKTLILWDINGDNPRVFSGHSDIVYGAIEISDFYLLSWGRDNNLILWDKTESPTQVDKAHVAPIKGLLVLSDGRILSWADNMLLFWRADLSVSPLLIKGIVSVDGVLELQQGVFLIWVSINSQTVYGSVYLLNINTGEFKDITSHQASIWGVNLLPDGRILSWGANPVAYLSNMEGELLNSLTHYGSISRVMPLLNGNLISLDMAGRLYLWDMTGNPIIEVGTHSDNHESISGLYGVKELKDGRILSWGADKTIRIWTLENKDSPPLILRGHTGGVTGASFLSDERIISWSHGTHGDKTFRLWDKNGELLDILDEDYEYGNRQKIFAWAIYHQFDPTELYPQDSSIDKFRIGKQGKTLLIYSPQTGETIHKFYGDAMFSTDPVVISTSPYSVGIGNTLGQIVFLRWVGEDSS